MIIQMGGSVLFVLGSLVYVRTRLLGAANILLLGETATGPDLLDLAKHRGARLMVCDVYCDNVFAWSILRMRFIV